MATTTTRKTTTRKTSTATKKTTAKTTADDTLEVTATATTNEAAETSDATSATDASTSTDGKKFVPTEVDASQYVTVRNGFQGRLVYKSNRTGEAFVWDSFGAEQDMELRELRNAKNSNKKFFINNWFMFDEDWIIDYLGVRQFYKNALSIDQFDEIFTKTPSEIADIISGLSAGQKRSVTYRAKELISESKIDSLSVISALESALGVELIEK